MIFNFVYYFYNEYQILNMYLIEHLLHINAPLNKVYEAIKEVENIKQWYTNDVVENSDKTKTFKWGEMFLNAKCNEIENEKITWKLLDNYWKILQIYWKNIGQTSY